MVMEMAENEKIRTDRRSRSERQIKGEIEATIKRYEPLEKPLEQKMAREREERLAEETRRRTVEREKAKLKEVRETARRKEELKRLRLEVKKEKEKAREEKLRPFRERFETMQRTGAEAQAFFEQPEKIKPKEVLEIEDFIGTFEGENQRTEIEDWIGGGKGKARTKIKEFI